MACFLLKSKFGERWIPEGEPYRLLEGEVIVDGAVRWECGPQDQAPDEVLSNMEKEGIKFGDAIAWVTKKFGLQQCSACKARQEILNRVSEVGWSQTAKDILDTFKS